METLVDGSTQRQNVKRLRDSWVSHTLRLQRKLYQTTLLIAIYMMEMSFGSTPMITRCHLAILTRYASAHQHQNRHQHHQVGLSVNNRIKPSLETQLGAIPQSVSTKFRISTYRVQGNRV